MLFIVFSKSFMLTCSRCLDVQTLNRIYRSVDFAVLIQLCPVVFHYVPNNALLCLDCSIRVSNASVNVLLGFHML